MSDNFCPTCHPVPHIEPKPKFEVGAIVEDGDGGVWVIIDFGFLADYKQWSYRALNEDSVELDFFESSIRLKEVETDRYYDAVEFNGAVATSRYHAARILGSELRYHPDVRFAIIAARTRLEEAAAILQGVMDAFIVKKKE